MSNPVIPATPLHSAVPGSARRRAPARWLIVILIVVMFVAAALINYWGYHERALGAASRITGEPGFRMEALVDSSGDLTFDQVLARSSDFGPPVKGLRHPPCIWYRLTVANESASAFHAILSTDNDYILDARLCQVQGAKPPLMERSGSSVRWFDRAVPAAKVAFRVELPARSESVFYVRVRDLVKQPRRFFLWNDAGTFQHLTDVYRLEFACYFALWFGLFIYNAFLYAVLRRLDYQRYLVYMLCTAGFLITASDVTTLLVGWPNWPLRAMVAFFLLNATTFSLVRFSRVFLDTSLQLPRVDPWLRRLAWFVLGSSIFLPLSLLPAWVPLGEAFIALSNILVLGTLSGCGLILYLRRNRQAGIYVLAFLPLAGALVYLLGSSFGIPTGWNNSLPSLTASALELIFLALALAWRYRLITDEADRMKSEYTAQLEQEVALRTSELRKTNASLGRANEDKDRVFRILGHDLRGPANMLSGLSQLMTKQPELMRPMEVASLAAEIEEACKVQVDLLDNLLLWGRTQSGNVAIPAQPAAVSDLVQAATNALMQPARRKGIRLGLAVETGLMVAADPKAVETIVRNLVGNAVKFTSSGGSVTVRAVRKGDQVEIVVSDTGVGIEPARCGVLLAGPVPSEDGTEAEKGTGLGLTLCRDLARGNGGDLTIASELRKGTVATLLLPAGG